MRITCATGNIRSLRMCRPLFASSSTWGFHRIVAPAHIDWIRAKHARTYVHCGPRYSDEQATASCCCFCCSRCRRIALEAGQKRQRNGRNAQMKYLVVFPCIIIRTARTSACTQKAVFAHTKRHLCAGKLRTKDTCTKYHCSHQNHQTCRRCRTRARPSSLLWGTHLPESQRKQC